MDTLIDVLQIAFYATAIITSLLLIIEKASGLVVFIKRDLGDFTWRALHYFFALIVLVLLAATVWGDLRDRELEEQRRRFEAEQFREVMELWREMAPQSVPRGSPQDGVVG